MDTVEIFGPGGVIAQQNSHYEHRPGQVKMAEAVNDALRGGSHLLIEAGTGTGKTLAYLAPAVLAARAQDSRIVISTGTKNLQEQIMYKDVPILQRALGLPFTVSLLKGRSNYLCKKRLEAAGDLAGFGFDPTSRGLAAIKKWASRTKTGDRSEIKGMPENLPLWQLLDARAETCVGKECQIYGECYITKMKARAEGAHILVVNHHLLLADLAVRARTAARVLPDYSGVIVDEAHLLVEYAAAYFGKQVSAHRVRDLLADLGRFALGAVDGRLYRAINGLDAAARVFFEVLFEGQSERFALDSKCVRRITDERVALEALLTEIEKQLAAFGEVVPPEITNLAKRVGAIKADTALILNREDERFVYWAERSGRGKHGSLRATPINPAGALEECLFDRVKSVVLTSATLTANGSFGYIRGRVGLAKAEEISVESPFDMKSQALLYLPEVMPDPNSEEWTAAAAKEIVKLLSITSGRAFILSTSYTGMRALHKIVSGVIRFPCLVQGARSKHELVEQFCRTPNGVLFGTASFWQGVDVRGPQLSCVVIDRLPFCVPDDPVYAARVRQIENSGGRPFYELAIPQAAIALKQGLGRLVRSQGDFGLMAILDPRITTKKYGPVFLRSLPRVVVERDLRKAAAWFQEMERGKAKRGPASIEQSGVERAVS